MRDTLEKYGFFHVLVSAVRILHLNFRLKLCKCTGMTVAGGYHLLAWIYSNFSYFSFYNFALSVLYSYMFWEFRCCAVNMWRFSKFDVCVDYKYAWLLWMLFQLNWSDVTQKLLICIKFCYFLNKCHRCHVQSNVAFVPNSICTELLLAVQG